MEKASYARLWKSYEGAPGPRLQGFSPQKAGHTGAGSTKKITAIPSLKGYKICSEYSRPNSFSPVRGLCFGGSYGAHLHGRLFLLADVLHLCHKVLCPVVNVVMFHLFKQACHPHIFFFSRHKQGLQQVIF